MKTILAFISLFSLMLGNLVGATIDSLTAASNPLRTREYVIEAEKFVRSLKLLEVARPNEPAESNQALLIRYFKCNQVVVEQPGSVVLDESGNRLVIRATKAQQESIRKLFLNILTNTALPPPPAILMGDTNRSDCAWLALTNAAAASVLEIYRNFIGAQLDIELPPEASDAPITLRSESKLPRAETARLIEEALREQAGIVVTRVDTNHLKVAFDSAVKIREDK